MLRDSQNNNHLPAFTAIPADVLTTTLLKLWIMLNRKHLGLFLGLCFSIVQICQGQQPTSYSSWRQFLGSDGRGVSSRPAPTRWTRDQNIQWRAELPGRGWSSPVIADGKIYVTSAISSSLSIEQAKSGGDIQDSDEETFQLCLLIIDLKTGKLLKNVTVMEQNAERPMRMHAKNSHASPSPIIQGERIYVHFGYQGTACLTLEGQQVWLNRELYFPPTHGNGGSPVLVDNHLIFTCDGGKEPTVVALNATTGRLSWQVLRKVNAIKTFSFCTPSVIKLGDKSLVIAPGSDGVLAISPSSGDVVWDFRYTGYSVVPKPVFVDDKVVISTGFDNARMLAIDPTGTGEVTDTKLVWELDRNVPKTPSMIAHDGLIYSISDDGIALCIDASDGQIHYRERIGGKFSASPIIAGENLYYTSEAGRTTVVRLGPEFEQVAENDLQERTLATMAIWNESLLIRTDDALYRVDN